LSVDDPAGLVLLFQGGIHWDHEVPAAAVWGAVDGLLALEPHPLIERHD